MADEYVRVNSSLAFTGVPHDGPSRLEPRARHNHGSGRV